MASQATFSLFKKADMEGSLEKVSSGIASKLKAGRTKVYCELYDTTLHIFKESKRTSTGAQEIDMKQVHTVRKATADKSGNQFEILGKNKAQTFVAPSTDECNSWVRLLQRSMTLKGQDNQRESISSRKMSLGDYETIAVSSENTAAPVPQVPARESNRSESGYAEVEFHNAPASPKAQTIGTAKSTENATQAKGIENTAAEQEETVTEEGGYSVVEVVRRSAVGQPVLQEIKDAGSSMTTSPDALPPVSHTNTEEYGYSTVGLTTNVESEVPQSPPELPAAPRTEAEGSEEEDSYGYAKVNRQPSIPAADSTVDHQPPSTAADTAAEGSRSAGDGASDDASDEDDVYVRLLSTGSPDPIPKFPYPLEHTDAQPLAELQEFLSNNRKVCRRSFLDKTPAEDPVGDMRKLLLELQS